VTFAEKIMRERSRCCCVNKRQHGTL